MARSPRYDPAGRYEVSGDFLNDVMERFDHVDREIDSIRPRKSLAGRIIHYGTLFILGMAGLGILASYSPLAAFAFHGVATVLGFTLGTIPGWMLLGAGLALRWAHKRDQQGRPPRWYSSLKERLGLSEHSGPEREATGLGRARPGVERGSGPVQPYRRGPAGWMERATDGVQGRERVAVRRVRVDGGQRQASGPGARGGAPAPRAAPKQPSFSDFGAL